MRQRLRHLRTHGLSRPLPADPRRFTGAARDVTAWPQGSGPSCSRCVRSGGSPA
jgi:hypothetical protein